MPFVLPDKVADASGRNEEPMSWVNAPIATFVVSVGFPSVAFLVMKFAVPPVAPAP